MYPPTSQQSLGTSRVSLTLNGGAGKGPASEEWEEAAGVRVGVREEGSTGTAGQDTGSPELNIFMFSLLLPPAPDFAFSMRAPLC